MHMRLFLISVGLFFAVSNAKAATSKPESSVALQIAKRVAQLNNSGNLPSRGLMAGRRVAANQKKLSSVATH
jgi:hypothetical protein